jgi:signal transduction histidine kinase
MIIPVPLQSVEPGTGPGLAICQSIVAEHGRALRLASGGPEGCRFEIAFPGDDAKCAA